MNGPLLLFLFSIVAANGAELVANGGFERGMDGWRTWSREAGALSARTQDSVIRSGRLALHLEHRGERDWSFEPEVRLETHPGDIVQLECWVLAHGPGSVTLCASTWDGQGKVSSWSAGEQTVFQGADWQHLVTRLVATDEISQIHPRLIGAGAIEAWVDDYSLQRRGNLSSMRQLGLPAVLSISNSVLQVEFHTTNLAFSVLDQRSQRRWAQQGSSSRFVVQKAHATGRVIQCSLLDVVGGLDLGMIARLDPARPELVVELSGAGRCASSIPFPSAFAGRGGDYLVVPMNEGISYPVDDASIPPMRLIAYGGHGICMGFFGVTDGNAGQMAILETPDDAAIRIERVNTRLAIAPEWDPQLGRFGETRRLRYVFFDHGGHVSMAKRYREYAKEIGRFKTLAQKRQRNPNVDRLIGAVNIWCWDRNAVEVVQELQAAGIDRILWSNQQSPENLQALNQLGVLTSRYDIYQDVMAPTNFPRLRWIHPDWTTNAWPQDIILDRRGDWIKGWGVEARDGSLIPCGVLCDRLGLTYARERVPRDLATHPYLCRFIDTTTAAPWNECYSPVHPMTRTQSRESKMELLRYISEGNQLVTGSETGHDAAVPFVDYFEGMLSLGPYRVPDAGRRMTEIWTNVPENVARFQLGQKYRLPLWELVYHDCVVAHWYWGDYNNKLPSLWDKRDLFNLLYGTAPMFMFDRNLWHNERARFVQSYQNTCPSARRLGYQEMTDHRFLSANRDVQETRFSGGTRIVVNFGSSPFTLSNGTVIKPMSFLETEGN